MEIVIERSSSSGRCAIEGNKPEKILIDGAIKEVHLLQTRVLRSPMRAEACDVWTSRPRHPVTAKLRETGKLVEEMDQIAKRSKLDDIEG